MSKLTMSTDLPASAKSVWNLIGSVNALPAWHPAIASSELSDDGARRTLHLVSGGSIVEQLDHMDDGHTYSYSVMETPFPVRNYKGAIAVKPSTNGTGCRVEWSGDFQPADIPGNEAIRIIQGIYQMGLDNLSRIFGV